MGPPCGGLSRGRGILGPTPASRGFGREGPGISHGQRVSRRRIRVFFSTARLQGGSGREYKIVSRGFRWPPEGAKVLGRS